MTYPPIHLASLLAIALTINTACHAQPTASNADTATAPDTTQANADTNEKADANAYIKVEADDLIFPDTVWLDNGTIKLGVSPAVGRITWFGFSDGDNLLWINPETINTPQNDDPNEWINYGGDKTWIGPQPLWTYFLPHASNWPPDKNIDGSPWMVIRESDLRLTMISPDSQAHGARIVREISMSPDGMSVTTRSDIQSLGGSSPMPMQAWNVTQTLPADSVALGNSKVQGGPDGVLIMGDKSVFENEIDIQQGVTTWTPIGNPNGKKFGTLGSWIAGLYGDTALVQVHALDQQGMYPENTNLQCYISDDYVELETLSPAQSMRPGKTVSHIVNWVLMPLGNNTWAELTEELAHKLP